MNADKLAAHNSCMIPQSKLTQKRRRGISEYAHRKLTRRNEIYGVDWHSFLLFPFYSRGLVVRRKDHLVRLEQKAHYISAYFHYANICLSKQEHFNSRLTLKTTLQHSQNKINIKLHFISLE